MNEMVHKDNSSNAQTSLTQMFAMFVKLLTIKKKLQNFCLPNLNPLLPLNPSPPFDIVCPLLTQLYHGGGRV